MYLLFLFDVIVEGYMDMVSLGLDYVVKVLMLFCFCYLNFKNLDIVNKFWVSKCLIFFCFNRGDRYCGILNCDYLWFYSNYVFVVYLRCSFFIVKKRKVLLLDYVFILINRNVIFFMFVSLWELIILL